MKIRHALPIAVLLLALAGCGSTPEPVATPIPTPDSISAAFAEAFATGDTPTACALAGGTALQYMTDHGWCQRSPGWSTGYWSGQHCQLPANSVYAAMAWYQYDTLAPVDGFTDFVIGVTGTDQDLKVTFLGANPGSKDNCAGAR